MTIAIGILARDSIVMSADTQETVPGFLKRTTPKIHSVSYDEKDGRGALMMAGAGLGAYIDAFGQEVGTWFARRRDLTAEQTQVGLSTLLEQFFARHVLPFASYPAHERPDFSVLIAFQRQGDDRRLLVSEGNTLRQAPYKAAIGAGELYARELLSDCHTDLSVDVAEKLAAWVIHKVKALVDSCGHLTHVESIQDGHLVVVHPEMIFREWDELFVDFDQVLADTLLCVLGGSVPKSYPFKVSAELFRAASQPSRRRGRTRSRARINR